MISEFGKEIVDLPGRADASLYFIGRIHTPWENARGVPEKRWRIRRDMHDRVDALWAPAFAGIETCTH